MEMPEMPKNAEFHCSKCGQKYLSQSGLWKHSKKCSDLRRER
jgi:hypothetical protein